MTKPIPSPYPYFGGKRKIAETVWARFGNVSNYVEPFFGSGAVLLSRPDEPGIETVNDLDGFISNFWRALRAAPDQTAFHATWPVLECDLHARHAWLVGQKDSMQARLEGDPDWFDAKIAGWWVWGMACWIGGGFCSGEGPWHIREIDGVRQLVHLGDGGKGVQRQIVHLGNSGQGVQRPRVHLGNSGRGVSRQIVHLGNGQGVNRKIDSLTEYFESLAGRMRRVRVTCGDWTRVCGPSGTHIHGLTAVFLDPPYTGHSDIYRVDSETVAHAVREWAIANGKNPLMRIALCGYEGEHQMPGDWDCVAWNAGAGYSGQAAKEGPKGNGKKERVWFSPHCLKAKKVALCC